MELSVREAAEHLRTVVDRLCGEGGQLEQAETAVLPEEQARAVASVLQSLAEQVRTARIELGQWSGGGYSVREGLLAALAHQAEHGLPVNRKERYYTGTVLPAIITEGHCRELPRFLAMCGLPGVDLPGELDQPPGVQILTEYSFAESRFTERDREHFKTPPLAADTPDVVLIGSDWMVVVEAKMFHRPSAGKLNEQIAAQRPLVQYWAEQLAIDPTRVRHVLLLPAELAGELQSLAAPVITWQDVCKQYELVGPAYWIAVLEDALARYGDLRSVTTGYDDDRMIGADLAEQWLDGSLPFAYVGVKDGPNGKWFATAVATGIWRSQVYQVRYDPLPENKNWFPVETFIQRLTEPHG